MLDFYIIAKGILGSLKAWIRNSHLEKPFVEFGLEGMIGSLTRINVNIANLYWSIIVATKEFEGSRAILNFSSLVNREIHVVWTLPDSGWTKCNVDSACRRDGGTAGCGGVYRD